MTIDHTLDSLFIRNAAQQLGDACHDAAVQSGWWSSLTDGSDLHSVKVGDNTIDMVNVPEKLMLVVSELGEAMEGHRKGRQDDHLPHRSSLEVEMADAVIRLFDMAGGLRLDLPGAIAEKLAYNASRADHRPEARAAEGGKKF